MQEKLIIFAKISEYEEVFSLQLIRRRKTRSGNQQDERSGLKINNSLAQVQFEYPSLSVAIKIYSLNSWQMLHLQCGRWLSKKYNTKRFLSSLLGDVRTFSLFRLFQGMFKKLELDKDDCLEAVASLWRQCLLNCTHVRPPTKPTLLRIFLIGP